MTQTVFLAPETARARGHWYLIDAEGQVLGRLATHIAALLRGKYDPMFTPHTGSGNCVVVINAEKVRVTGDKLRAKMYTRYSGYPGGLKQRSLEEQIRDRPIEVIHHAVKGMLPHTPLGRQLASHLHVYAGAAHPHQAQAPTPIQVARGMITGMRL